MAANPFTRGSSPGRARPPHRGNFKKGHPKHGGRKMDTPNAISPRARKAIEAATKRIPRGITLNRNHWQGVTYKNPLITEARVRQGQFTLAGTARFRSRTFNMKAFCQDLSDVAMHAIMTDQYVDRDLVECLTLLGVRDASEFAKFLSIAAPKQSYLAARPHAEAVEPRESVNPGEHRRHRIPEWTLGFDPTLNSWIPVPVDPALTPQDAHHEVCGSPLSPKPGWPWVFDSEERRLYAIDLRPKTPIPEWTCRSDGTPVPVDRTLSPDQAYHNEYGSPLYPAPGVRWPFNPRTERFTPTILEESSRYRLPSFAMRKCPWLCRWHPDDGYYSLVRDDDGDAEGSDDTLYEYDTERLFFKRYHPPLSPVTPTKPCHQKIEPEPETPPRRLVVVRHPDGTYAIPRADECGLDDIYEYDAKKNQFVRLDYYTR
jgi:hypothetical protein